MQYIYERMNKAPFEIKIPKDFKTYLHGKIFKPILYDRFKRKAHCYNCDKSFNYIFPGQTPQARTVYTLEKFTSRETIECPLCNNRAVAVTHNSNIYTDHLDCIGWLKDGEIRYAVLYSFYKTTKEHINEDSSTNVTVQLYQFGRIARGGGASWVWSWFVGAFSEYGRSFFNVGQNEYFHLHPSIKKAVEKSWLKHTKVNRFINCAKNYMNALNLYARYPQLEYLEKFGLDEMVNDKLYRTPNFIYPNWKGRTLPDVLGITAQDIDKLKQWKMFSVMGIAYYKLLKKNYSKVTKNQMTTLLDYPYGIDFFYRWRKINKKLDPLKMAKTVNKAFNDYRPGCHSGYTTKYNMSSYYTDYLNQMHILGYPDTEYYLYPSDLIAMHDRVSNEYRLMKDKEKQEKQKEKQIKLDKRLKKLNNLIYENDLFIIRPLKNYTEFSEEGRNNNNCVASYFERSAEGKTNIFAIRQKADTNKSYVTLELNNSGTVVQCRGRGNTSVSPEVEEFVAEWLKKVVKKKQKEAA